MIKFIKHLIKIVQNNDWQIYSINKDLERTQKQIYSLSERIDKLNYCVYEYAQITRRLISQAADHYELIDHLRINREKDNERISRHLAYLTQRIEQLEALVNNNKIKH